MIKTGWVSDCDTEQFEDELAFNEAVIQTIEVKPGAKRYTYDLPHLDEPVKILRSIFEEWGNIYGGAR